MSTDLGRYLPSVYDDIYETDLLITAENAAFDEFKVAVDKLFKNQYIVTADEDGIEDFEKTYKIVANPDIEDLEFRRQRVLSRASLTLPFSIRFLRRKLDEVIGASKYLMNIDYGNRELRIESAITDSNWYHEVNILIGKIKPCNMVYVNNPFAEYAIKTSEQIEASELIYNYRLGTTWALGQNPFIKKGEMEVIKMPDVPSIQQELLADMAGFTADDIDNVLINDMLQIDMFEAKQADENIATIMYSVPEGAVTEITNIKLRKGAVALCSSNVYVPATSQIDIKHKIAIREGV